MIAYFDTSVCSYGMQLENMLGDILADKNYLFHRVNLLVLDTIDSATRLAKEASTSSGLRVSKCQPHSRDAAPCRGDGKEIERYHWGGF